MNEGIYKEKPPWMVAIGLMIELACGALGFAAVAVIAAALNLLVHYLQRLGVDSPLVYGLQACEYLLFASDVLLFTCFVISTTARGWKVLR